MSQLELGGLWKKQGMAKVGSKTDPKWKNDFWATGQRLMHENGSVTAEEIVKEIGYPDKVHPNAIGATMHGMAKALGLNCTFEKSTRPSRHAAVIARWHHLS